MTTAYESDSIVFPDSSPDSSNVREEDHVYLEGFHSSLIEADNAIIHDSRSFDVAVVVGEQ